MWNIALDTKYLFYYRIYEFTLKADIGTKLCKLNSNKNNTELDKIIIICGAST